MILTIIHRITMPIILILFITDIQTLDVVLHSHLVGGIRHSDITTRTHHSIQYTPVDFIMQDIARFTDMVTIITISI